MTKIDIISGFLGAGKTTLIKKLLKEAYADEQVVLIENEFGEIGIDGGFLKEAGIEIREMNSGCICCSLVGDFGTSLKEVISTYHPDRIVIEPSGVGKLSDVIKAVENVKDEELVLNSFTTVVDVNKCKMYMKNFGEFYRNQVETAGTIILSRTDVAKEEKVEDAVYMLREMNEKAAIITTPIAQLDGKKILETMEYVQSLSDMMEALKAEQHHHHDHHEPDENCTCGCHDHEHHHSHEHYHDHDHHHEHDENCTCGCHDHEHHHSHEHDHEHHHGHEHHEHDENCTCGCHDHEHHHKHDHEHHHDHDHHEHDENCTCGCHDHGHHHHHADEVFTSWGRETGKKYTKETIETILKTLNDEETYGFVLRAKGMVASENGQWVYFDMVPGELEVRDGAPEFTGRICVIGSKLKEDAIAELFGV